MLHSGGFFCFILAATAAARLYDMNSIRNFSLFQVHGRGEFCLMVFSCLLPEMWFILYSRTATATYLSHRKGKTETEIFFFSLKTYAFGKQ